MNHSPREHWETGFGSLEKGLALGLPVSLWPGAGLSRLRLRPPSAGTSASPRTGFLEDRIHRKGFVGDQVWAPVCEQRGQRSGRRTECPGHQLTGQEGAELAGPGGACLQRGPMFTPTLCSQQGAPGQSPSPSSPRI